MENADFSGRVAIITGAWRGLGRAAASRLHERGASVAVNVRDSERAETLAKEIGERAFAVPGDIAAEAVADEIAQRTLERFGRIDILVNNAALPLSTRFPALSLDEWRKAIDVNLTAPFLMTKAVLSAMRAQNYGRIINISSSGGRMVSTLGGAHYTASKAGLIGMIKTLGAEYAKRNITANCIAPGFIATPMTDALNDKQREAILSKVPAARLGTPEEIAAAAVYLSSNEAGYVTGQTIHVNGGMAMI